MPSEPLERCAHNGVAFLRFASWDVPHAISLRRGAGGGAAPEPSAPDLLAAAGLEDRQLVLPRQRHTSSVLRLESGREAEQGDCDALITDNPKLVLGIQTADCIPVLIVDPIRRTIGAVHAGWRGSLGQIVPRAIEALGAAFGSQPCDLRVALGPAIGGCCYEIGADLAAAFAQRWPHAVTPLPGGKARLDLRAVNAAQAQAAGVGSDHMVQAPDCTRCQTEFPSYRRDGQGCGRILTLLAINP